MPPANGVANGALRASAIDEKRRVRELAIERLIVAAYIYMQRIARRPVSKRMPKYPAIHQSRARHAAEKATSDARSENARSAKGRAIDESLSCSERP